jgi:cysteinyl-tRNA synthetase
MKLYNSLGRHVETFIPHDKSGVTIYSCGPTVYDHIHVGNLSAFIAADTLRRTLVATGYSVRHVMNFTDVDDKTIRRSKEEYSDLNPMDALKKLTRKYEDIFLHDMEAIGNDIRAIKFVRATESIEGMRSLIRELHEEGFAYITDDGVYFSIDIYKASGKEYGQLLDLNTENTSASRINNDEYDKESVHDFALWKTRKNNEPAWDFELDGKDLTGRPGWHIECSVMSVAQLGQPFDIHTGGVDLVFPHHENEIAQSTAGTSSKLYAKYFVHNEHLLVDGKKMSKSLKNFYTLEDVIKKGYDPLAFRLMVLQSHYRNQANFTWENLEAAQNRLKSMQRIADLKWNTISSSSLGSKAYNIEEILDHMQNDLSTPQAIATMHGQLEALSSKAEEKGGLPTADQNAFNSMLENLDKLFGFEFVSRKDISNDQKDLLKQRARARTNRDWDTSDHLRDKLKHQGIGVKDSATSQIWYRL